MPIRSTAGVKKCFPFAARRAVMILQVVCVPGILPGDEVHMLSRRRGSPAVVAFCNVAQVDASRASNVVILQVLCVPENLRGQVLLGC